MATGSERSLNGLQIEQVRGHAQLGADSPTGPMIFMTFRDTGERTRL